MKYKAQERAWVRKTLVRLTPSERTEYERRCGEGEGRHRNGKFYDGERARIAERVMLECR